MVEKLEAYVMVFLGAAVMNVTDPELTAWCFAKFAELSTEGKHVLEDSVTEGVVRSLASRLGDADSHVLQGLSVESFRLYVRATESMLKGDILSFREYIRLRNILLWACRRVSLALKELVRGYICDDQFLRHVGLQEVRSKPWSKPFIPLSVCSLDEIMKLQEWVDKVDLGWSRINLQLIHPEL